MAASAAGFWMIRTQSNTTKGKPCFEESTELPQDLCVLGYTIIASFDALPKTSQKLLARLDTVMAYNMRDLQYSISPDGQMQFNGGDDVKETVARQLASSALADHQNEWGPVRGFLEKVGKPFDVEARANTPKTNRESCDPTNAWTLRKLKEESLRECMRTIYLLGMQTTFNPNAKAIFAGAKIEYRDRTIGALSLDRPNMSDNERNEVVKAVKKLDRQIQATGGYN